MVKKKFTSACQMVSMSSYFCPKHSITFNYYIDVDENMTRLHSPGQIELQIEAHRPSNANSWSLNQRKSIIIKHQK